MRSTIPLPGETEAGTAGMQPCRGIAWWAHRDDDRQRENQFLAVLPILIGSKDPHTLKIPAPAGAEPSLTENVASPFHAEPGHPEMTLRGIWRVPTEMRCKSRIRQTKSSVKMRRNQQSRRGISHCNRGILGALISTRRYLCRVYSPSPSLTSLQFTDQSTTAIAMLQPNPSLENC